MSAVLVVAHRLSTVTMADRNGPVWAYYNLSRRFTVTPESTPGEYSVTIDDHGSFTQVASPTTGACETGSGSVRGTIQYDVTSPNAPDPSALPAQENGSLSTSVTISHLFGGNATITGCGSYYYTYTLVDGEQYTQSG